MEERILDKIAGSGAIAFIHMKGLTEEFEEWLISEVKKEVEKDDKKLSGFC